ncbi:BTAD domain-containing putative transcriptional regulator [Euzebya rosea]|uniref:BTAD domain-containing putative transcriptional regulator n=1 Tax=Euzebya rosea TaxID=2052804 RepID=UPI00130061E4|nr:BTAD domain-containing putative transcriptional regulator [Euzebya rosea]
MQIDVLGPLTVRLHPDSPPIPLPLAERSLLAMLATAGGRALSADRLIDGLWGARLPADPANALQVRVSKLRRALPGAVVHEPPGYRLADGVQVDLVSFERLVAARRFADALALWRGDPLEEMIELDWARAESARLLELHAHAHEELLEQRLAAGGHEQVIGDAQALLVAHPLRERLRGQLMLALHRSGRTAEALEIYQEGYRVLDERYGLPPSAGLRQLQGQILADDPALAPPAAVQTSTGNIGAPLQELIGRQVELDQLREALAEHRVVTVTGPGGAGKTTIALALARDLTSAHRDGCWLVRLAEVADGAAIPAAIARAIGLDVGPSADPSTHVRRWLHERQALLLLDNCEHLIDACAHVVEDLLGAGEGVRVLATSREALGVHGEVQVPLPPLPPADGSRLFVARAHAVRPGLRIAEDDPVVARICERLDGVPLAIELAAARVGVLPPQQLLARLDDRFGVLTAGPRTAEGRHQTLRAVIDWSYDLLSDGAQRLVRRLSVFAGGWTVEAAEDVCAEPGVVVLDLLDRLVAQSMVALTDDGRFDLLQTVRLYAAERHRADPDDVERTGRRHADFFTRFAEEAEPGLRGPDQRRWLLLLRGEEANLRAALDWAESHAEHEADLGLRLTASLGWYWYVGRQADGRGRLATMLAAAPPRPSQARARALQSLSLVLRPAGCIVHPHADAAAAARESRALLEDLGLVGPAAVSALLAAVEGVVAADPLPSVAEVAAARARLDAVGDAWGSALADFVEMELRLHAGDLGLAIELGVRAATAFDRLDDAWGRSAVRLHLGMAMRLAGRIEEAERFLSEVVSVATECGLPNNLLRALVELGESALHRGDPVTAERKLSEAEQVAAQVPDATSDGLIALGRGTAARLRGDRPAAEARYREAIAHLDAAGVEITAAAARVGLGAALLDDGAADPGEVTGVLLAALDAGERHADMGVTAASCEQLARVAARDGEGPRCSAMLARASSLRRLHRLPAPAVQLRDVEECADCA